MSKKYNVVMIFAPGCPECQKMRESIILAGADEHIDIEIEEHHCEDIDSINIAIDYGITDVPGCNIGGIVVEGEGYNRKDLVRAIKSLSK